MKFKTYSRINNIVGWLVFGVAAFTYLSTIEHSISLWDCGEFLSSATRLEVSHPPGAPFFILLYHVVTLLAGSHVKLIPILTNSTSALNTAFCILFLFWSITALSLKFMVKDKDNMDKGTVFAIMGAGVVGALAFTFSDTVWFSAVETIVFAMSIMMTSLIFWLLLKWEARSNQPNNLKWLVLIFYFIGLAVGVHLLGLLLIPVIFMVYYFKKYPVFTWKGILLVFFIGLLTEAVVQYPVIRWMPEIGAGFDRIFVNGFGLPFWSGLLFFYLLVFIGTGYLILWSHKNNKVLLNTSLLCFISIIIGYSSYALCPIRSYAEPAINMGDTKDIYNFIGYLGREQYGDIYILDGPYYTAFTQNSADNQTIRVVDGAQLYRADFKDHQYVDDGHKKVYEFPNPKYKTFFPRMASQGDQYINGYRYWGNVKNENNLSFMKNNMPFFFSYQLNYMYWRYFAWNFIGRQNDFQGIINEFFQGNWITGIPFIDDGILHTGPQKGIPKFMSENKAHTTLFGLPFILGLLGMYYQYKKNKKDFFSVLVFFFMTGIAIEIYLNMPSPQPRERDYAFVGSFYAYSIWIGFGVFWLFDFIRKRMAKLKNPAVAILASGICLVVVPVLMAFQEWPHHDRSKRLASHDYGADYLYSCAPHAVLFTNGDNDTYPLWYCQEVEGIRDDVRIVNLSLFGTDSYINQMRRPINHAVGLPFTLTEDQTLNWDYVPYYAEYAKPYDQKDYTDLKKVLEFIASKRPDTKLPADEDGFRSPFLPTKKFSMPIDKEAVIKSGTVALKDTGQIVKNIDIDIHKNNMFKSDVMLLDFIMTNNWKVPVYFSITSGPDDYLGLGRYLQQEGLTYRLVPIRNNAVVPKGGDDKRMAVDTMYKNITTKFVWGALDKYPNTYMDYVLARQSENLRGVLQKLSSQLMYENKLDSAVKIVDMSLKYIPESAVPYFDYYDIEPSVEVYYKAGLKDKARKLAFDLADNYTQELKYYADASKSKSIEQDLYNFQKIPMATAAINYLVQIAKENNDTELLNKVKPVADTYNSIFPQDNQQQGGASQEDDPGAD